MLTHGFIMQNSTVDVACASDNDLSSLFGVGCRHYCPNHNFAGPVPNRQINGIPQNLRDTLEALDPQITEGYSDGGRFTIF